MRFNNNFLPSTKQGITDFLQGFRQEYYPERCGDCCRNCLHDLAFVRLLSCCFAKKLWEENPINREFKIGFLLLFCPLGAHEKSSGRNAPPILIITFLCGHPLFYQSFIFFDKFNNLVVIFSVFVL
jgi:hypothetical protein